MESNEERRNERRIWKVISMAILADRHYTFNSGVAIDL
jgi:hypothetical protein